MISIFDVPRADRGRIWALAEEAAGRNPSIDFVAALAAGAVAYAEAGAVEPMLVEAIRCRPATLMRRRR